MPSPGARSAPDEISGARCVACGGEHTRTHLVPEAMFRTGETFPYLECGRCGTLQIVAVPTELAPYYDSSRYYSFRNRDPLARRPWLSHPVVRPLLAADARLYSRTGIGVGFPWMHVARVRLDEHILDLGCGEGGELRRLRLLGFRRLTGADPYLPREDTELPGVRLLPLRHDEIPGRYDVLVMNHAFEHVPDPRATLRSARRLLAPGGRLVIRMPIRDCEAWDLYGVHWVQLDAPRHLAIYTVAGFQALLAATGFRLCRLTYDSWAFQFWGSELVRQGRPHAQSPTAAFSAGQLRAWQRRSAELNRSRRGDSVLALAVPA